MSGKRESVAIRGERVSRKPPAVRNATIGDGTVRVTVLGRGRPVLFLHGISAHGRAWRPVAERFAEEHPGWECWLPDLPGRGASDARAELSYSLDDEVRRLRAVVRALAPDGPRPQLVAGHSQGAAIALALAEAEPDIGGLLLSNPVTPEIRSPAVLRLLRPSAVRSAVGSLLAPLHAPLGRLVLRRACGPSFRAPAELVAAYARPWASPARARTLLRILADWHPAELKDRMPRRPVAAHVVTGAHDPRIPVAAARRLAARLDCDLTVSKDGGHVLTEQHPRLLARLLGEVAARLPPLRH
ncbi:MAG: alpha/beta hydrolase [Gemmatimonadales bacterium]|nr:alpha/beta hydrolase [Gemmatimonadales bacterium]MXX77876.1 alpha/beta hydrolase [Gemmatimonadales bacterium]MYC88823.1 alpha/beta hydrolase [Candidatus Palauibacter denitrificans]